MQPVVGWNETADRRQFRFISVLFHDVRLAYQEIQGGPKN